MKVNFTAVKCFPQLRGNEVTINFGQQMGESIYQGAKSLKDVKLANRIYDAEGEMELSDEEKETVKNAANNFIWWAKVGILRALGEEPQE